MPLRNSAMPAKTHIRRILLRGALLSLALLLLPLACCTNYKPLDYRFAKAVDSIPTSMQSWPRENAATRGLLERYRPRIFIAPDSYRPLDFYRDYLPDTRLVTIDGDVIAEPPTREQLVELQRSPDHYLDYLIEPDDALTNRSDQPPAIYGRVYTDTLKPDRELIFLKYSLVFPYSGIAADTDGWKGGVARLLGSPKAWHELDIHGAIHVILDGKTRQPLGILLAQHNHQRTFLAGRDFEWPPDDRVPFVFAYLSNEPYLLRPDDPPQRSERSIGDPRTLAYLVGRDDNAPISAGFDRVFTPDGGAEEIETRLKMLPHDDPLYTSWMPLGARRKALSLVELFFFSGPPGIDYYAFGDLKNLADLAAFADIDPNDDTFFELKDKHYQDFKDVDFEPILKHQRQRFYDALEDR
jgi:hypothetical protein